MRRRNFLYTTAYGIGGLVLPAEKRIKKITPTRFGIVTDIHYSEAPDNIGLSRYYHQSKEKLAEFVEVMNEEKVDFIIELGDLKDQRTPPNEAETLKFLDTIENTLRKFNGPVYHVLGNHDHDSISKSQFLKSISNHGFHEALNYYSFSKNGLHFVVLDANYNLDGKEYDHGNFDWTKAFFPTEQLNWLKEDLKKDLTPTLVFVHHQLDSLLVEDTRHCPQNAQEVRKILEDSGNVSIVFQGHFHKGQTNILNDICYYTLKSLVNGSGPEHNNYAIVEIDADGSVRLKGYRQTASEDLPPLKS